MSSTAPLTVALHDLQWLQRLATLLTVDADEADDLVQETLVTAWRDPPRDLANPVRPWLATVLRNRFRMLRRSGARRSQRELTGESLSPATTGPDHELARIEILQLLVGELHRLPPEDQKILVRRYFNSETATDIGRALGLPPATVRSRLHRSLQRLRGALDDRFGDRERWSMAILAAPSLPAASPNPATTKATPMSLTAKLLVLSSVGAVGIAGWLGMSKPTPPPAPAPTIVAAPAAAAPTVTTPKAAWEQRRSSIRQILPPPVRPAPTPAPTARADEDDGLRSLVSACMADLASKESGAITLSLTRIGAPDIGTIYDDVTLIETTFPDKEVLDCLLQSMYGWVGEAPDESFERNVTTTFVLGKPAPDVAEQRVFEAIVGAHISEVRYCERRGDPEAPEARGQLSVAFDLGDDGKGHARGTNTITRSTDLAQPVQDCILTASRRWAFPRTMNGRRFEYHYTLPIPVAKPIGPVK